MQVNGESNHNISFAEFELDTAHRRLLRDGKPLALYAKTFDLLAYLLEHNGEIVTKNQVLATVWKGQFVEEANLSVQISALRKALGEKKDEPRFLVTVPGKGYKFVADVRNGSNEIVIEKHKVSRVVVHEDLEIDGENRTRKTSDRKFPVLALYLLAIVFLLCVGLGGSWVFNRGGWFRNAIVEKQPKIKKLTNTGKVGSAVLSPDGRFFAYAEFDKPNWQTSIRLAQVDGSSDVVLRPVADIIYRVTGFSADAGWLYYTAAQPRESLGALYKMPVLGGVPQKLADGIHGFVRLSPDEKQIAYVRNDKARGSTLFIANSDGSDQRELAVRPYDKAFFAGSLSWSSDGRSIALAAAENQNNDVDVDHSYEIFAISASDGTVDQVTKLQWGEINRVEWLKDGSGLAVVGREKESTFRDSLRRSLWSVDYPSGKARKITVDLNTYSGSLGLTADSSKMLAVQGQSESNIWMAPADDLSAGRQITFGSPGRIDGWYGMDWTPDGHIVYTAYIDQNLTIWIMDADGTNARQLTPIGFRDMNPNVSADGGFIVFQSNRSGKSEIWRMGTDGSNLRQLTSGSGISSYPSITPDGDRIFYMNERGSKSSIWRISVDGGDPLQISNDSSFPRVSPDGNYLACAYDENGKTLLGVFPIEGGSAKLFGVPSTFNFNGSIRWTPDGKAVEYRDWANGIWQQSMDGGDPQRLNGLPKEKLLSYAWSRDGKHLAFSRGREISDVVLITDIK